MMDEPLAGLRIEHTVRVVLVLEPTGCQPGDRLPIGFFVRSLCRAFICERGQRSGQGRLSSCSRRSTMNLAEDVIARSHWDSRCLARLNGIDAAAQLLDEQNGLIALASPGR